MRKELYSNLKKLFLLALIFCSVNAFSQNPAYQITSTVGGFVAPQMSQAQRLLLTATSLKGTLVYQTDVTQGYYYYDGAAWKLVNDAASLTGILPIANGGTNISTIGAAGSVIYSNGTQHASTAVGTAGQFLVSNGAAAPGFGLLGQSATTAYGTAGGTLSSGTGAGTFYTLPGLSQPITVPANAIVKIASDGGILAALTGGNAFIDVAVLVDGVFPPNGGYQRLTCPANTFAFWSFSEALVIGAGSHTISIAGAWNSGNGATINGNGSSVLQGELTVTIIKQ